MSTLLVENQARIINQRLKLKEDSKKKLKESLYNGMDENSQDIDQMIERAHDKLRDIDEQTLIRLFDRYEIDDTKPVLSDAISTLSMEDKECLLNDLENAIVDSTDGDYTNY